MTKIKIQAILEMAGFPEEHLKKTMGALIKDIEEKDIYVVEEKEVLPIEKKEELFTSIIELTLSVENIVDIYEFCFNYMPSSIDIIEPIEKIEMKPEEFNQGMNDLIATIHEHDRFLKNSNTKIKVISNNMNQIVLNIVNYLGKEKKGIKEISEIIGIKEDKLKEFIKHFQQNNKKKK